MTRSPCPRSTPVLLAALLACFTISGCGGSEATSESATPQSAPEAESQTAATESSTGQEPTADTPATSRPRARDEVWVDAKGQKWFGKVPMDAFFDKPYEVASNDTPLSDGAAAPAVADAGSTPDAEGAEPAMAATKPAETDVPTPEPTPEKPATAAADGWETLMPVATLDEEVKNIRNFLQENVSSVGSYNSSMMMIPPKVATLAALAEIARNSGESVSWKDDAAYVRDLAKKMNENPLQRGAKDQKRLQELFESVADILNRSKPSGLEEPPETDSFAEVADMRSLMKRMEEAEKILKTEVSSEDALGSKKTVVAHEAAILSTLANVVIQKGYGYEDDNEFTGYGKSIVEAAQSAKQAGDSGDYSGFEAAMSKVATTCQNCHSKYKND
ncbi:MAG UNVERIFIED_CONTAM: cytochrome c [Planctomycetaceae bacterium]